MIQHVRMMGFGCILVVLLIVGVVIINGAGLADELVEHNSLMRSSSSDARTVDSLMSNMLEEWLRSRSDTNDIQRRLVSCDDLDYDNKDDSYSPNDLVKNGHRLSNQEFCPERSYYNRVAVAPIVLTGLYLLMFLSFFFAMLCRCCIDFCQCQPDSNSSSFRTDKLWNTVAFYSFSLISLAFSLLILLSNFRLDSGIRTINSASEDLEDVFRDSRTEGRRLDSFGASLSSSLESARTSCAGASASLLDDIEDTIGDFSSGAEDFIEDLDPAIDALRGFNGGIDLYSGFYRQLAIYLIFGLTVFYLVSMLATKMFQSLCGMQLFVVAGMFLFLCYSALLLPFTAGTSALGDFCMDPSRSAVNVAPKKESAQDIAIYFSTCAGNSTFHDDLFACRSTIDVLNNSLSELQASCPDDNNVETMLDTIESADDVLDEIDVLVECEPVQDEWFSLFNDGLCGDFYDGIFYLWLGILLAGFFIFVLTITGSFTYHYFDVVDMPIIVKKKNAHPSAVVPGDDGSDEEEAEEDEAYAQRRSRDQRDDFVDDDEDFDPPPFEEADSSQIDIDTEDEENVVQNHRRRSR